MIRFAPLASATTRVLLLGALGLTLLSALAAAQAGEDDTTRQVRRFFMEGLAADSVEERIESVRTLELSGLPESAALMREGLDEVLRRHAKRYARYLALGRKVSSATRKQPAVSSKARAMAEKRSALAAAIHEDEQLGAELRATLGRVFAAMSPAAQDRFVASLADRIERVRSRDSQLALLETIGHLRSAAALRLLLPRATSTDPVVRLVAVEALGRQNAPATVLALAKALEDPCWQVQAMAVDAMATIGGVAAVDSLVRALDRVDGRLRHDVSRALARLTGEDFRLNSLLWRQWWREHKAGYRGPPDPAVKGAPGAAEKSPEARAAEQAWRTRTEGTSFYGIHTCSKRIVYVLDLSNSMNEALRTASADTTRAPGDATVSLRKIDQARRELRDSIAALPEDARFNIVLYNHEVHAWRTHLITATQQHKRQATEWVGDVRAAGNTNIFDALERAFALTDRAPATTGPETPADTIYLLSDGRANRGRVTAGKEMRREIRRLNRRRGAVVHTVALGADADLEFMRGLAADSGGQTVHIGGE